jgi:hypothetical protein
MDGDQPYIKEPFICMRGCEYLLAAKELGYEAIDCIIADDEVWLKAIEYALKQG